MILKKIANVSVVAASVVLIAGCQTPVPTKEIVNTKTADTNVAATTPEPSSPSGSKNISFQTNVLHISEGGGSKERPKGASGDLPNLPNGVDFSWVAGSNDTGTLLYAVKETDQADVCNQQLDLLANTGWAYHYELSTDFSNAVVKVLKKTGYTLSVTCSANTDTGRVDLTLVKGAEQ